MYLGGSGSGDGDIISSQQELRGHAAGVIGEEYTLPGHVVMSGSSGERIGGGNRTIRAIYLYPI